MPKMYKMGERLKGRYEIHDIKEGAMGLVYICFDHDAGFPVALKTFRSSFLSDEKLNNRFRMEAETWVKLGRYNHIVWALFVETIENTPYIVLEYVDGGDLSSYIKRGMKIEEVLNFAIQFCKGMAYANEELGIVHRDIKPANILVTRDKIIKVSDFGLVKAFQDEDENYSGTVEENRSIDSLTLTSTGSVLGTPPYMSPEQCLNSKKVDIRSDIYSFGAVLYQMLTGRYIFRVKTVDEFLNYHLHKAPVRLTKFFHFLPEFLRPAVLISLNDVVMKCLNKEPNLRYKNFSELLAELSKIYNELTGQLVSVKEEKPVFEDWELMNIGISLVELGKKNEAIEFYDRSISVNPKFVPVWRKKGTLLFDLERYEEALICFNTIIGFEPDDYAAWYNKGVTLDRLSRSKEAINYYDRALKLNPKFDLAWNAKGILLDYLGKHEEAINCFDKYIEMNPEDVEVLHSKGHALYFLGKLRDALKMAEQALAIDPVHPGATQLKEDIYRRGLDSNRPVIRVTANDIKKGNLEDLLREHYQRWKK